MGILIFGNQTIEIPPDNNDWEILRMGPDDDNLTAHNLTMIYNWSSGEFNITDNDFYDNMNIIQKVAITFFSIVFALGIIGNGLVIWIAGFRMKKSISAVWFLHLAIADFLCCASLPLRIVEWVTFWSYHFSNLTNCTVNVFIFNLNMNASVLLLTAMSIDRWVSVMWPFWAKVHKTYNVVRISAAIIWGLSLILCGLVYYAYEYWVRDLNEWCVSYPRYPVVNELTQTLLLLRFIILCVIPFLIIITAYVTIFHKIRKSKRSQRSQRSSRIITAVILCFFICWFPYYIWPLIPWFVTEFDQYSLVNTIVTNLACLNSCMNPIIYVFMAQDFQRDFFRSISYRLERALGEHPNDLSREDTRNSRTTDV
ncbi:LOW QUALITY PROTEIN: formyl peptide receptor-related sequence 1-like [Anomaloglossus baeobatrachus]